MGAVIPLVIAGIGAGISAYSAWKAAKKAKQQALAQGQAEKAAADDQAELIDFNAHIGDQQATDAEERGEQESKRFRQGVQLTLGSTRASLAAQGIDVDVGSAVDVQADEAFMGELDAHQITTNAAREAWGYRVKAYDLRQQAEIRRREGQRALEGNIEAGNAASTQLKLGAVSGIVNTAGSIAAQRYGFGGNSSSGGGSSTSQ